MRDSLKRASVTGVVCQNKYLILQVGNSGEWEFSKRLVEQNESDEPTAIGEFFTSKYIFILHYIRTKKFPSQIVLCNEHKIYAWLTKEEIQKSNFVGSKTKALLAKVCEQ